VRKRCNHPLRPRSFLRQLISPDQLIITLARRGRAIRSATITAALTELVAADLVAGTGEDHQQHWVALPTVWLPAPNEGLSPEMDQFTGPVSSPRRFRHRYG
jgi:hypothetical protein